MALILVLGIRLLAVTQAGASRLEVADPALVGVASGGEEGPSDERWTGHLSYAAGVKILDHSWFPARVQGEYGALDVDARPPGWPLWLTAQFLFTYSSRLPQSLRDEAFFQNEPMSSVGTYEFNVGIREVWDVPSGVQIFAGGGASVIGGAAQTYFKDPTIQVKDYTGNSTVGVWASAGAYLDLGAQIHLGAEVQYSRGDVTVLDHRMNAGGFHALLMFGVHW